MAGTRDDLPAGKQLFDARRRGGAARIDRLRLERSGDFPARTAGAARASDPRDGRFRGAGRIAHRGSGHQFSPDRTTDPDHSSRARDARHHRGLRGCAARGRRSDRRRADRRGACSHARRWTPAAVKRRFVFWKPRRRAASSGTSDFSWDASHIAECERRAIGASEPLQRLAYGTLAKVLSALFTTHGCAWGTRDLIVPLARDLACNASR